MTEERILDFLDGNLGSAEEEELLHRLAVSPERRSLLKQHLQVRELTSTLARRQYVPVPKVVTASLFTTLASNGYAGPQMPAANENAEALISSLEKNLSKSAQNVIAAKPMGFRWSSVLLASLVSFIAGGALIYSLMPEPRQEKFASSVSQLFQGAKPVAAIAAPKAIESNVIPTQNISSNSEAKNNISATTVHSNLMRGENPIFSANSKNHEVAEESPAIGITEDQHKNNAITETKENIQSSQISPVDAKDPLSQPSFAFIGGSSMSSKNPFDHNYGNEKGDKSLLERTSFIVRFGGGKAPGNQQAYTGSLLEVKASTEITDWFVAKVSLGQFMPYETQAISAGFNSDNVRLIQLSPVLQYRTAIGAEVGIKFSMFNAPFELTGGVISDLQGSIIPRGGFFTSLMLQDNLNMNIGLEAMIYSHDISPSLQSNQNAFAGQHPSLIGELRTKESAGFIGPAVELAWHF